MGKAILILACLVLVAPVVSSQRKRPQRKPKSDPLTEAINPATVPKDELLFDEYDYLIDRYVTWRLASRSDEQPDHSQMFTYYDPKRVIIQGVLKQAWLKTEKLKNDELEFYWLDLYEFDCKGSRFRILETHEYNKTGNLTEDFRPSNKPSWVRIIPDSVGEEQHGILCLNRKDQMRLDMEEAARFY